jgi:hypothetical protein
MRKSRIELNQCEGGIEAASPASTRKECSSAPAEDLRTQMVSVAAYFIAEKRSFVGGCAEDDWYAAEAEIDRRLAQNSAAAAGQNTR